MSEGPQKIPSALDIANARADALRATEKAEESAVTTPTESPPDTLLDIPIAQELPASESELGPVSGGAHTPKEWREKLRGLVIGERAERLASYLKDRSAKLDAGASELGVVEKSFRALGERYNKLGWKSKLGVGLALGAGSAAFSGVSLPIAFACTSGLALQRVAGMASVFLKYEKKRKVLGKEGGLLAQKEKAMLKAMAYSIGMSLAIGEAVSLASESSYGEAVHEWLKQNWFFGGSEVQTDVPASHEEFLSTETSEPTSEMQPANPVEAPSTEPELEMQQSDTVPSTEAPAPAVPAPEEVPVSPSTEPASNPEVASADTETAKLISKEWGAEYAGPGTAPEVAAATDLSAQEWRAEYAEPVNHTGAPDWRAEHIAESEVVSEEASTEIPAPADTAPQAPVTEEVVTAPNAVPTDAPPAPAPETSHLTVNTHGLEVATSEPHIYADNGGEHLLVYGGSPAERARLIGQYFQDPQHANHIVYGADDTNMTYRIPWHFVNGEVLPGEPVRTDGFLGFLKSFMPPPEPDELRKLIQ